MIELDLLVRQLAGAGQFPRQPRLARALGARAVPAQEFELIGGLMAVSPLDREQPPGAVGKDVEGPLAVGDVRPIETQVRNPLGGFVVARREREVEVLPVGHLAQLGELQHDPSLGLEYRVVHGV